MRFIGQGSASSSSSPQPLNREDKERIFSASAIVELRGGYYARESGNLSNGTTYCRHLIVRYMIYWAVAVVLEKRLPPTREVTAHKDHSYT